MSSTSDWGPNHCTMSVPRPACNLCKSHMTPCLQRSLLRRSSPLLLQSIKAPTLRRVAPIPTRTVSSMAPKPKNEIKNKWVAVVGASRGIGLEVGLEARTMPPCRDNTSCPAQQELPQLKRYYLQSEAKDDFKHGWGWC